ncbi:MAG: hypothetical protein HQ556_05200 [Candidatus Marinimicrobia bacterium]|nr:hypothetical protein [Candidatus Neomarinimicrobiota bacterium]
MKVWQISWFLVFIISILGCSDENITQAPISSISDIYVSPGIVITDPNGYHLGAWGNPDGNQEITRGDIPGSYFRLSSLYPNPSTSSVIISFSLAELQLNGKMWAAKALAPGEEYESTVSSISSELFQVQCPVVRTIWEADTVRAGYYSYPWDGLNDAGEPLPRGIYRIFVSINGNVLWQDFANNFEIIGVSREG